MATYQDNPYVIRVEVESVYVEEESVPDRNRYAFAYTVTIRNEGAVRAGPQRLDRDRGLLSEIFWLKVLAREGAEDDPEKAT